MKKLTLLGALLLAACRPTPTVAPSPAATSTPAAPTPLLATASATLPPAPTLTPTPPPRFFTEQFDALPAYWSTLYASGPPGRAQVLSQDGGLRFEIYDRHTWVYSIFGAHAYASVHLEARVREQGSPANYAGLVCQYDEAAGWFEFNLSSAGGYTLLFGQWLAEDLARYTPILEDSSPYILTEGGVNEFGLDCTPGVVQLYFNGKLFRKLDVSRFGLDGGKIGLAAASFEDLPVILTFEWLEVGEP